MKTKWLPEKSARNRKSESQREGSYFCGGFGREESVKRLQSDSSSKRLAKKEWICQSGARVEKWKKAMGLHKETESTYQS